MSDIIESPNQGNLAISSEPALPVGFRFLAEEEIIKENDRIAMRVPGGWCISFRVHSNFYGHPGKDARFPIAREGSQEGGIKKGELCTCAECGKPFEPSGKYGISKRVFCPDCIHISLYTTEGLGKLLNLPVILLCLMVISEL
jgi:hypothetical protein